jgi:hypothetical protein
MWFEPSIGMRLLSNLTRSAVSLGSIGRGAHMLQGLMLLLQVTATPPMQRELSFRERRAVESSHSNYYELRQDDRGEFLHAEFRPGDDPVKEALALPEADRHGHFDLSWRWRVLALPVGANDCVPDKTDSAASVYVVWRRGLRWYGLKYTWSSVGPLGAICDTRDNPFLRGDAVILETGGPLNVWREERIDIDAEFRRHFANGDPSVEIPDLVAIAVLTNGSNTGSPASADYGSVILAAHAPTNTP